MTIQQAEHKLNVVLSTIYDTRESSAIASLVMEHITHFSKIDRIIQKSQNLTDLEISLFEKFTGELLQHRPVQYVLGEAWFLGSRFQVSEKVLIPRPETEDLVHWVLEDIRNRNLTSPTILDVGTGSGIIPITLGKLLPSAVIHSCDISPDAINIAKINAIVHAVNIHFLQGDFLDHSFRQKLPAVDYIVSNPPYIPVSECVAMSPHVVQYEPHLALFVPDEDPLIFYRALAFFANEKMFPEGKLFAELHAEASEKTKQLFRSQGLHGVEIKSDMQGIPRMIKATRLP